MANSVDPDEMACYELSHLDLHCLQSYMFWSTGCPVKAWLGKLTMLDMTPLG